MRRAMTCGVSALLVIFSATATATAMAGEQEVLKLTTAELLTRILDQNLAIQSERLNPEIALADVMSSKGTFDTTLSLGGSHEIDKSARQSTFFGTRTDRSIWNIDLSKELPSGTVAGLGFNNTREKTFGAPIVNGVPVFPTQALYEPVFEFSLTQPLMKNIFGYNDRRTVMAAEHAYSGVDYTTQHRIQQIVYRAFNLYWDVHLARQHLKTLRQSVSDARQFLRAIEEKSKLGTAEETDLLAARANLNRREADAMSAAATVRDVETLLRDQLALGPEVTIDIVESPAEQKIAQLPLDRRITTALTTRPDFLAAKSTLERRKVELAQAKNSRWPQLDLVSTLALNNFNTSYANAVGGADHPDWTIGMQFSVPLENRVARAGHTQAEAQKAQAIFALKQLEVEISNQVARLSAQVEARWNEVGKRGEAERFDQQKLHQELSNYRMGRSSSDTLIRYQDDLVSSQRQALNTWREYLASFYDLQLAEGTIVNLRVKDVPEK